MGVAYLGLGDKKKALEFYNQDLPIRRATSDPAGEAVTLGNIGAAYGDLGDTQKALDFYSQALPLFRTVGNRAGEANALANLQILLKRSQPDLAIFFGKQAVNVLQTVRRDNRGLEDSLRRSYEKSIESTYRNLAGLLVSRERFRRSGRSAESSEEQGGQRFHSARRRDRSAEARHSARFRNPERWSVMSRSPARWSRWVRRKRRCWPSANAKSLSPAELDDFNKLEG